MTRLHEWQWIQDHKAHYLQDPEAAHDWDASPAGHPGLVPTLLLHTRGRKSGEWRASPLLYQPCGVGFVIVGSRGDERTVGHDRRGKAAVELGFPHRCQIGVDRGVRDPAARRVMPISRPIF